MPLISRKPLNSLITGVLLIALGAATIPAHAVWHWMRGAALTDFSESDWNILKATARDLLDNKPDHEQVNWTNPETGNRGSIIGLATFAHDGQKCRRAAMRNLTFRGRDDKAAYTLCRQADGEWRFVSESALLAEESTPPVDPASEHAPASDQENVTP